MLSRLIEEGRSLLEDRFLSAHDAAKTVGKKVRVEMWAVNGRTFGDKLESAMYDLDAKWIKKPAGSGVSRPVFEVEIEKARDFKFLMYGLEESAEDGNIQQYRVTFA
jgi:hypothetical protein